MRQHGLCGTPPWGQKRLPAAGGRAPGRVTMHASSTGQAAIIITHQVSASSFLS
jgi:hypothetical protein